MDKRLRVGYLGRTRARHKQVDGLWQRVFAQITSQFEADKCPHTMPEESERFIKDGQQRLGKRLDQLGEVLVRHFLEAVLAPGKLDRADFHMGRQMVGPGSINRGATARVRKTE